MPRPREDEPLYRFHGHRPPTASARRSVLNFAPDPQAAEPAVATIRLYDPIDSWGGDWGVSAKEFTDALDQIPDAQEIRLHINSPGGEVWEGIAILNALRNHPASVTAIVDGIAASAASFIAAGADRVVMGRNAQMMIHDARGISIGAAADMRTFGDFLDKISDNIAAVYQEKAGGALKDWRAAMLAETWYSADEAVAAGLADSVQPGGADAAAVQNAFDLTIFKHPGRAEAPAPPLPTARTDRPVSPPVPDLQKARLETRLRLAAARYGLPLPTAAANDPADASQLTQALGWFTAIDSIVDEAQEALAAYLNVPSPDPDETDDVPAA